jgi:HEPN domain-containing protein
VAAKRSKHVRRFLTAADARLADAQFLREARRTLAAVYLAGYAVEFILKALVLGQLAEHQQLPMIAQFRGAVAHDYRWLLRIYREHGGAATPAEVAQSLTRLDSWGTELRYNPRTAYPGDIDHFFQAVEVVVGWGKQRL